MDDPEQQLDDTTLQREKLATIGQLTAGIAHDLNNPIGFIASNINALGRYMATMRELIDDAASYMPAAERARWTRRLQENNWAFIRDDLGGLLGDTQDGAAQVVGAVADLKHLARSSPAAEQVSLDRCIDSAINVLRYHFRRGVNATCDLQADTPLELVRAQIIQLVTNLLHNSIQAMGPAGGQIRILSRMTDQGAALCRIEDSGPGLDPQAAEGCFAPFYTTKAPGAGTGLGLAIARRIAEEHGGHLACVAPERLEGAAFEFTLAGYQ